jgi:hypothetical protein
MAKLAARIVGIVGFAAAVAFSGGEAGAQSSFYRNLWVNLPRINHRR